MIVIAHGSFSPKFKKLADTKVAWARCPSHETLGRPGFRLYVGRMPSKLSTPDIKAKLRSLPPWQLKKKKLHREFKFKDFVQAFSFMTACALVAEKMNHHPEWFNVWSSVMVDLQTHDAGGITELDFTLAGKMEKLAKKF